MASQEMDVGSRAHLSHVILPAVHWTSWGERCIRWIDDELFPISQDLLDAVWQLVVVHCLMVALMNQECCHGVLHPHGAFGLCDHLESQAQSKYEPIARPRGAVPQWS